MRATITQFINFNTLSRSSKSSCSKPSSFPLPQEYHLYDIDFVPSHLKHLQHFKLTTDPCSRTINKPFRKSQLHCVYID